MATINASNEHTAAIGKILQGQGVGNANDFSTATYPAIATGTGKILRADGTNWVPSTATFPDTAGTSGNVLTSDGTNWVSQAFSPPATGSVINVQLTLTNSQIKNLNATPITLIASPGAGFMIKLIQATGKLVYGGSNVFTAGASQSIGLFYGAAGQTAYNTLITNAILTGTTSQYNWAGSPATAPGVLFSLLENKAIVIQNPIATEISGNAANNNTAVISAQYCIVSG